MSHATRLVGKRATVDAEAILVFRVGDKYYPNTEQNGQSFEAYLHTGDENYLKGLEGEVTI
jgi:hypothetical protein